MIDLLAENPDCGYSTCDDPVQVFNSLFSFSLQHYGSFEVPICVSVGSSYQIFLQCLGATNDGGNTVSDDGCVFDVQLTRSPDDNFCKPDFGITTSPNTPTPNPSPNPTPNPTSSSTPTPPPSQSPVSTGSGPAPGNPTPNPNPSTATPSDVTTMSPTPALSVTPPTPHSQAVSSCWVGDHFSFLLLAWVSLLLSIF